MIWLVVGTCFLTGIALGYLLRKPKIVEVEKIVEKQSAPFVSTSAPSYYYDPVTRKLARR